MTNTSAGQKDAKKEKKREPEKSEERGVTSQKTVTSQQQMKMTSQQMKLNENLKACKNKNMGTQNSQFLLNVNIIYYFIVLYIKGINIL